MTARFGTAVLTGPEIAGLLTELRAAGGAEVHYVSADFTRMRSVVDAARAIRALAADGIDLLVNDGAVPGAPTRLVTDDGFERTFQVNALAPGNRARLADLYVERLTPFAAAARS